MALGTTYRPERKRNDIIKRALLDVKAIKLGQAPEGNMMRLGVDALNEIIREEDQDKTGNRRFLTALATGYLFLEEGRTIYTTAEGLADDIHELHSVYFRDAFGGERLVDYITPRQYEMKSPKTDVGDPLCVYLQDAFDVADKKLFVWPIPGEQSSPDTVLGSDGLDYQCTLLHTSSTAREPITGTDYLTYWKALTTTAGSAWADATEYASGGLLRYLYKRPLFNFDSIDDDPDLPDGWATYLRWRLALDLSATFDVKDSDRNFFGSMLQRAADALFPSNVAKTTDYHNKALYF